MFLSHTAYSFRFGVIKTKEVVALAEKHNCIPLVLAEINSTAGIIETLQHSKIPIQPALDFRNKGLRRAVLFPESPLGFQHLNTWLSQARTSINPKIPQLEDVRVVYPLSQAPKRKLLSHEWIGIEHGEQIKHLRYPYTDRCLAWETLVFRNDADFNSHRLLRAIDQNTTLSNLTKMEHLKNDHRWESAQVIQERFSTKLWSASQLFLRSIPQWDSNLGKGSGGKNLKTYTGSKDKDKELLRQLCIDALPYRYPEINKEIKARLEKELYIIEEKSFLSYFLINWDIARYAQEQDFFYVGRGSGANSMVAYLLKITNVDPIDLDLYFERFINLYRQSPPDFDLDFSWKDRRRVTEYIFNRFPNTALLGACNTFQHRAVIRELGKVFGLPKFEIDALVDRKTTQGESVDLILKYANKLQGLPNQMSIHSGGILISQEPLHVFSTTFMPPKGFTTVDFDMYTAEDLGLHKFDILGQRGLSKISECISIIKETNPTKAMTLDIHNIKYLKTDPSSISLLQNGGAMGCFYVESPAMRMLMQKLQTSSYLELVAASSVIRPGVAKSGMMKEYIQRHRYPDKRSRAHPILMNIMPETYGVMIYQEDVIRVAHHYAGLTLAESDVLRRGMSGKYRSREEFKAVENQFFINCKHKGYSDCDAREVWRQIESFAGYAFAKGHSASYAVESFQSLYLKAHFPLEYMVATINNGGGFYRPEFYFQEARRHGAKIEAPCVNEGAVTTILRAGKRILLGMARISGINEEICKSIEAECKQNGVFASMDQFINRMQGVEYQITLESLLLLIRSGAFRFTQKPKRALLWEAHRRLGNRQKKAVSLSLFEIPIHSLKLPDLISSNNDDSYEQLELFGFTLKHPFSLFTGWQNRPSISINNWNKYIDKPIQVIGYVVTIKYSDTLHGERMQFGTFQEFSGEIFDTVHFPNIFKSSPIKERGLYIMKGVVKSELEYLSLNVHYVQRCLVSPDTRYSDPNNINRTQDFI